MAELVSPSSPEEPQSPKPTVAVELRFSEDGADRVACYTSLDDFTEGTPMTLRDGSEETWVCILNFPAGRYLYRFLVDGEWRCDEDKEIVTVQGNSYNEIDVEEEGDNKDGEKDGKLQAKKNNKRKRWKQKKKILKARRRALQTLEPVQPQAAGKGGDKDSDKEKEPDEEKIIDAKAQSEKLKAAMAAFEESTQRKVQTLNETLAKERADAQEKVRQEREQWIAKIKQIQQSEEAVKLEMAKLRSEMAALGEKLASKDVAVQQFDRVKDNLDQQIKTITEEKNGIDSEKKQLKEENKSLKRKMKSWKTEVKANYQKQLDESQTKYDSTVHNQAINIDYLKREIAKFQKEKETVETELVAARADSEEIKKQRNESELQAMDVKAALDIASAKLRLSGEENDQSTRKIRELEAQVEELTRKQAGMAHVSSKELDSLRKREGELIEETKALKASEQKLKEEAKTLRSEKFALSDKIESLRSENEKNVGDLKQAAEQEANSAKAAYQQAQSEIDKLKLEHKTASGGLEQQLQDYKTQLEASKKELATGKTNEDRAKEEIKKLLNEKWALEKNLTKTQAKLESQIKEMQEGGAEKEKVVEEVSGRLDALTKEREALQAAHDTEMKEIETKLQAAREEEENLRKTISTLEGESRSLKEAQAALTAQLEKQAQSHKEQVDDLNTKIKETQGDRDSKLASSQASYETLKKERDDMAVTHDAEVKELNGKIKAANDELESLRKTIAGLEGDVAKWKDSSDSLSHKLSQLEKDTTATIESLRASVKKLEEAKTALQNTERKLSQEKANIDKEHQALKASSSEIEKKLRDELNGVSTKYSAELKVSEERKSQLELLEASDKRQKGQITTMTQQIDEITKERDQAMEEHKKEVKELQTSLEGSQSKASTFEKQLHQTKLDSEKAAEMARAKEDNLQKAVDELKKEIKEKDGKHAVVKKSIIAVREASKNFRKEADVLKQAQMMIAAESSKTLTIFEKTVVTPIEAHAKLFDETLKKYKKELTERRKYFNLVQELRGNIRVCIRARPIMESDAKRGNNADKPENCLAFPDENIIGVKRPGFDKKEYEFDRVYPDAIAQEDVFKDTRQLIGSVMDGYNVCIIAYGQTGSGKTYTMEGPPTNRGVNYRALRELFSIKKKRGQDYVYEISVSMMEIYNETVLDLLNNQQGDKEGLIFVRVKMVSLLKTSQRRKFKQRKM